MNKIECFNGLKSFFSEALRVKVSGVRISYCLKTEKVEIEVTTETPLEFHDGLVSSSTTHRFETSLDSQFFSDIVEMLTKQITLSEGSALELSGYRITGLEIDSNLNVFDVNILQVLALDNDVVGSFNAVK